MNMGIAASLVLSLIVVWFVVAPFFEPALAQGARQGGDDGAGSLLDAKERALRALKDLELDHSMGKVSAEDFDEGKRSLSVEIATILKEIQRRERE
jgi:hypothetical protein